MTKATVSGSGSARQITKKAQLIAMLQRKSGATIVAVSEAFGWQQHTTRAALSRLRRAGYAVELRKPNGKCAGTYHIAKQLMKAAV